jgi:hypothetical protein
MADHVPVPVAAIVAIVFSQMLWSGPALGLAVTITDAVSVHPPLVHMKLYVPAALKVVIVLVALPSVVMVAVPGFPACAVHVPIPVAAMVADPPGSIAQLTVWSGPAFAFEVTITAAVSVQPLPFVQT